MRISACSHRRDPNAATRPIMSSSETRMADSELSATRVPRVRWCDHAAHEVARVMPTRQDRRGTQAVPSSQRTPAARGYGG